MKVGCSKRVCPTLSTYITENNPEAMLMDKEDLENVGYLWIEVQERYHGCYGEFCTLYGYRNEYQRIKSFNPHSEQINI